MERPLAEDLMYIQHSFHSTVCFPRIAREFCSELLATCKNTKQTNGCWKMNLTSKTTLDVSTYLSAYS